MLSTRLAAVVVVVSLAQGVRADGLAEPGRAGSGEPGPPACLRALDELGVAYQLVKRPGIELGVQVEGDLGGVTYHGYQKAPLILDCSLVVSLARAGRYLTELGVQRVTYSSAYQRRRVRASGRWSKHSFGLAIDIHTFAGDDIGVVRVKDDYEQGLGDDIDCVGEPLTQGGAVLRTMVCQFMRSELFDSVLTPDYDAAHYNHYHLAALPWNERGDRDEPAGLGRRSPEITRSSQND